MLIREKLIISPYQVFLRRLRELLLNSISSLCIDISGYESGPLTLHINQRLCEEMKLKKTKLRRNLVNISSDNVILFNSIAFVWSLFYICEKCGLYVFTAKLHQIEFENRVVLSDQQDYCRPILSNKVSVKNICIP